MNNVQREGIYLRDRNEMTPAQRRRHRKHAHIEQYGVVIRASRMRKALERRDRLQNRRNAVEVITAMRRGFFRPTTQRLVRARHAMDVLKAVGK